MGHTRRYIILLLSIAFFTASGFKTSEAQVSFGLFSSDTLELNFISIEELDFGARVSGEGVVTIDLENETEGLVVPLEIVGIAYLDVTVTFPHEVTLLQQDTENPDEMILNVRMAYSNSGLDEVTARTSYTEVPANMGSVTFQIQRRPSGPPGPPPTPPHAGYTPPKGTAYIYIYGVLDVGQVGAGTYRGDIDINVQYF